MAKPGRNDPCPCGSGKKYKKCCLAKDEADERVELADEKLAARRPDVYHLKEVLAGQLARTGHGKDVEIAVASHAVVKLVHNGKLAEAETAARDLLTRYPDEPDSWDCLAIVHEARGENRQAADCYRKVLDIIRQHPDEHNQEYEIEFAELIARLDPPTVPPKSNNNDRAP
jgi:tetratricopeptide (TPR) repeat protein